MANRWIHDVTDLPLPALVVLIGPSGSIKSTWAARRYAGGEIVSSDQLWSLVVTAAEDDDVESAHRPGTAAARRAQRSEPTALRFGLQLSAFQWGEDPRGWLADLARTAESLGFSDLAVMDHLLQIPQVGRASWDLLPEAYVTLGHLSGITDRIRLGTLVSPMTFRARTAAGKDARRPRGRVRWSCVLRHRCGLERAGARGV